MADEVSKVLGAKGILPGEVRGLENVLRFNFPSLLSRETWQ